MNRNDGFSLIEIIIVIAIMAVLTAIIVPNLIQYLSKTKEATDIKNLEEVRHQVDSCVAHASIDNIEIIDNEDGVKQAEYLISFNSVQNKSVTAVRRNGTTDFAKVLDDLFYEEKMKSQLDKKYDKVLIIISGIKSAGYSVEVKYVS